MAEGADGRLIQGIRRAWDLVAPRDRRRLRLVALYGVLIAGLDTVALILIYALVSLMTKQPLGGVADSAIRALGLSTSDRYRTALILLAITSALFIARSLLSVFVLWLTVGATNSAQAGLISRLLIGHARAPQLVRLEQNSSETLRTVLGSVDQVVNGVVFSSVSLVANGAVAVAVALGLILASPSVAVAAIVYFALIAVLWVRVVRGGLARRGRVVQELSGERYRLVMQGLAAAKELQLRGRALFYAEGAVAQTRKINAAQRVASVVNGSLRYMLETSLVIGAVLVVGVAGLTGGRDAVLPAVGLVLAGAFRLLPALNQILFLTNSVQYSYGAIDFVERELATFGSYAQACRAGACRRAGPAPARTGGAARGRLVPLSDSERAGAARGLVRYRRGRVVRDRREDGLGEEHAARRDPRDPRAGPRHGPGRRCAARPAPRGVAALDRLRAAGRVPRRRHAARERRARLVRRRNRRRAPARSHTARRTRRRRGPPAGRDWTRASASAACASRAARNSGSDSRGPCTRSRACSSSTRRPRTSTK